MFFYLVQKHGMGRLGAVHGRFVGPLTAHILMFYHKGR